MRLLITVIFLLGFNMVIPIPGSAQERFNLVKFETADGGDIEGAFFPANSGKVVIFAHGAIFNKESWYFLNEQLQELDIASLSIDFRGYGNSKAGDTGNKYYDILGAIAYLKGQGYRDINIVGGSMGGAAVLTALAKEEVPVNRVVLMAPAGGPPVKSAEIDKLFIGSREGGLYNRGKTIFTESSQAKQLKEFNGKAHAQHMFKEEYAPALTKLILDFLSKD